MDGIERQIKIKEQIKGLTGNNLDHRAASRRTKTGRKRALRSVKGHFIW